jgi:transcriptional regulator with XRE-family HTH domain
VTRQSPLYCCDVAKQVGTTYQQFQKYEAGINRISASRLQQIGNVLQVPPSFFFEDLPKPNGGEPSAMREWPLMKFVATAEGLALVKAFGRIQEPAVRRAIITLIEKLADPDPEG